MPESVISYTIIIQICILPGTTGQQKGVMLTRRNIAADALNRKLPPYKRIRKVVCRAEEFKKTTTRKRKRNYERGQSSDV